MAKSLIERAQEFTNKGDFKDLHSLLFDSVTDGTSEGLQAIKILAQDMYGGITFNMELKSPAAFSLLAWNEEGIKALLENAYKLPTFKNYSIAFRILSTVSAGVVPNFNHYAFLDEKLLELVKSKLKDLTDLKIVAKKYLNELIMSVDDDEELAINIGTTISSLGLTEGKAISSIIRSLSLRWIGVGLSQIKEFEQHLDKTPADEDIFQVFLERNPLFVDPMALRVWPKPDLHGKKAPDFIVQRSDNSYLVVEIEIPAKQIVTKQNQISHETSHAVSQVLDYHSFLLERFSQSANTFPHFSTPDCLVVIGIENKLTEEQKEVLRRENASRSRVKIMGFDVLLSRARSITENIIEAPVKIESIRLK